MRSFKSLSIKLDSKPALNVQNPSSLALGGSLEDLARLGETSSAGTHFYELLLEFCERLFDNELEQHVFEDRLRCMFGMSVREMSLDSISV